MFLTFDNAEINEHARAHNIESRKEKYERERQMHSMSGRSQHTRSME